MKVLDELLDSAKEVSRNLGPGYNEAVYEEALMQEFRLRKIPYERQRNIEIIYKNHCIGVRTPDCVLHPLWSGGKTEFLVEIKCANKISEDHLMQATVYLNSMNIEHGFVLNFNKKDGSPEIETVKRRKRILNEPAKQYKRIDDLKTALESAGRNVLGILGTEFAYNPMDTYINAVAVELRLMRFEFGSLEYPVLYKDQKVSSYSYNFVFKNGEVADISFYKDEDALMAEADNIKKYNRLFGVKRGYLLGLPLEGDGQVLVKII